MRFSADRNRLMVLLIAILAAGFLTTSLVSYFIASDSVRKSIVDQQLPLTGDNVYSEIQRDLLRPIYVSMQMAHDTFLRDWLVGGEQDQNEAVRYLTEVKTRFGANTAFLVSELTRKYYYEGGLLKVVSEGDPLDKWYFRVRQMREPYELNPDVDEGNRHRWTTFVNYRILDHKDRYIGAVGVGITFDDLQGIIDGYQDKFKRRIFFVDASGDIVLAGKAMAEQGKSINDLPGMAQIAAEILRSAKEPARLSYRRDNETIQVNSRFVPELKWHLIVEEGEDLSISPLRNILGANLLISALATVLVLAVTLYTVNLFQRRLEHVASTDALSGLGNREMGEILFDQAIRNASRFKQPLCAILVDIDHFKQINDSYGHQVGDAVIHKFGGLLRGAVRDSDVISRWGGEEFLVLMIGSPLNAAIQWGERMRATIEAHDFGIEPSRGATTASFGIAELKANESRAMLFARVDAALYSAKAKGRNQVVVADEQK